jgi:hypothetical protein
MSYRACIEAAGVPVIGYHSDGDYQGTWIAYTARGFYTGSYGSCSGCDWRQCEQDEVPWDSDDREALTLKIDKMIGEKILGQTPMDLDGLKAWAENAYLRDKDEVLKWAESVYTTNKE